MSEKKKKRKKWHFFSLLSWVCTRKKDVSIFWVCSFYVTLNTSITTKQKNVFGTHPKSSLKADLVLTFNPKCQHFSGLTELKQWSVYTLADNPHNILTTRRAHKNTTFVWDCVCQQRRVYVCVIDSPQTAEEIAYQRNPDVQSIVIAEKITTAISQKWQYVCLSLKSHLKTYY